LKFEHLRIAGFGRLADLDIDFGQGLTIVAGPNEAGKSTIVECLLRLLFGFPEAHFSKWRKRYEPRQSGVPYAARLRYRLDDGHVFEVARDFAKADVPTETVEFDSRRPVAALSGNKSTSPGESVFQFSLDVYRRAAVVSAGDFAEGSNGAVHALAERLAAIIGSAGDASAKEAIERLKRANSEIGLSGANTPLGKAVREADEAEKALRRFRSDYAGLADNIGRQVELSESVRDLAAQRSRCAAAHASARLGSIRARIDEAAKAQAGLDRATSRRTGVVSASPAVAARREDLDRADEALKLALGAAAEASTRSGARDDERASMQRDVDGASAALLEKRSLVARLDEKIASHEAAAAGRPAIALEMLSALERDADDADAAEGAARTLATQAAIARQRPRPAPARLAIAILLLIGTSAAWFATHVIGVGIAASVAALFTFTFAYAFVASQRRRSSAIAQAEQDAAEAAETSAQSLALLNARCRELGCSSVAAVRAARTAQAELDRVRAEKAAASEAASILAEKRDALARRIDDFNALDTERGAALERVAARKAALTAVLDEIGIEAGTIDERLAGYRRLLDGGEEAARGDEAIAIARGALEKALRGETLAALEGQAARCAADAAGGDPGEYAGRSEADLARELASLQDRLREDERALEGAQARIAEFERLHPVPAAELEERADAAVRERDRLKTAREAAERAWTVIEEVRDEVHRNFTPTLNEAVGSSAAAITGGRYTKAWIDPNDFTMRVRAADGGDDLPIDELSTGTFEQFQFALRAALAAALGSGERVPILFDDALAHADDERFKAALARASELANAGDQIVFFTQRSDAQALAASLPGVHLIRLPGPAR
jgi:hypothetical protein